MSPETDPRHYYVVVIGGGRSGVQAAISTRLSHPSTRIALIRRDETAIQPCAVPFALSSLQRLRDVILPDDVLSRYGIDVIIGEVVSRQGNLISFRDGRQVAFDKLVLATGSVPAVPAIPGIDQAGVHVIPGDYRSLVALIEAVGRARSTLVIGGNDVGVGLASELKGASKSVTLVEAEPTLLSTRFDPEFAQAVRNELSRQRVVVVTETRVAALVGKDSVVGADLENGHWVTADLVIVSPHRRPSVELALTMGLRADMSEGIAVDEYLRTSDPNVYAVGDCVAKRDFFGGELRNIMLGSDGMAQARLLGWNLGSEVEARPFCGSIGGFVIKVGSLVVGVVGLTEGRARGIGVTYTVGRAETVRGHGARSEASTGTFVKLLFDSDSLQLIGAQVSGDDPTAECVNMLSVMVQQRLTLKDIACLQLGTHPLLTPSPLGHGVWRASAEAMRSRRPADEGGDMHRVPKSQAGVRSVGLEG